MPLQNDLDDELRFMLYRLRVVSALPEGPYKDAILRAIENRLQALSTFPSGRYRDGVLKVICARLDELAPGQSKPGSENGGGHYQSAA